MKYFKQKNRGIRFKTKTDIEASITSSIDKLDWEDSDKAIESIVKMHDQTLKGYKNSGLGS